MEPWLRSAVENIFGHDQGFTEEYLLSLGLAHAVLFIALAKVALVPVKANHPLEVNHLSILP